MSEETQEIKEEQTPETVETAEKAEAPATEAAPEKAEAPATEAASSDAPASEGAGKTKKINRISAEVLNKKIKALEEKNQIHSKYYKHLVQRKNELENANA